MKTQRMKPIHLISTWSGSQREESSLQTLWQLISMDQATILSQSRSRQSERPRQEHHLEVTVHHQALLCGDQACKKLKPKSSISEKIFNRWKKTWTLNKFGWTLESNIPKFSTMILKTPRIAEMVSSTSKVTKSTSSCLQTSSSFLQTSWSSNWYTWAAKAAPMT